MKHENLMAHQRRKKSFLSLIIYSRTKYYHVHDTQSFSEPSLNIYPHFPVKLDNHNYIFSLTDFPTFMPDFMNLMRRGEANFSLEINETVIFVICNWLVCNSRSLFIAISIFIHFIRFKRQSKSTHNSIVAPWESTSLE